MEIKRILFGIWYVGAMCGEGQSDQQVLDTSSHHTHRCRRSCDCLGGQTRQGKKKVILKDFFEKLDIVKYIADSRHNFSLNIM